MVAEKTVIHTYVHNYRIAGIYYECFYFANFANRKALAKIKFSIYFWINIVQTINAYLTIKFKNHKYFF